MNLKHDRITTGLFFLWHCFILQHLLVEVQLISHVNGIDLLFLFPVFFPQNRQLCCVQQPTHLWAGVKPCSAAQQMLLLACRGAPKPGV